MNIYWDILKKRKIGSKLLCIEILVIIYSTSFYSNVLCTPTYPLPTPSQPLTSALSSSCTSHM